MGNQSPEKVRIDKWLWATRWFKSRSLATTACQAGKVKINGDSVKPSYNIQPGQEIHLTKNFIKHIIKVDALIEKRVGAPLAQKCYTDLTPPQEVEKFQQPFFHHFGQRDRGTGRPTKKERRDIEKFKDYPEED